MKKTNQNMFRCFSFMILALSLACSLSWASGSDVGRGGETVSVDGRPSLRDLVDNTDCLWITASTLGAQLPHFAKILQSIDRVHWMLAFEIKQEAKSLKVCRTRAPLVKVPTEDQDGLTIYTAPDSKQVAIRLNDQIYLDMNEFAKMSDVDQAYLLLHEISHSFIPLYTERRNTKLRSFVAAIRENEKNPMDPETFGTQLSENSLTIPPLSLPRDQKERYIGLFTNKFSGTDYDIEAIELKKATTQDPIGTLCVQDDRDSAGHRDPAPACASMMSYARRQAIDIAVFQAQYSHYVKAVLSGDSQTAIRLLAHGYAPIVPIGPDQGGYILFYSNDWANPSISVRPDGCYEQNICALWPDFYIKGDFTVNSTLGVAILNHDTALVQAMIQAAHSDLGDSSVGWAKESHWFGPESSVSVSASQLAERLGFADIQALFRK